MSYRLILASQSPARLNTLKNAGLPVFPFVSNIDEDDLTDKLPAGFSHSEIVTALATAKAHRIFHIIASLCAPQSDYAQTAPDTAFLDSKISGAEYEYAQQLTQELPATAELVIFGCDSMLLLEGQLSGKPHNADKAIAQIEKLSGSSPVLYTGHCILKIPLRKLWESSLISPNDAPLMSNIFQDLFPESQSGSTDALSVGNLKTFADLAQICGISRSILHFSEISGAEAAAYVSTGEPLKVAGGFTIDGLGGAFINGISGDYHGIVGISLPLLRQMVAQLDIFWPHLWEQQ